MSVLFLLLTARNDLKMLALLLTFVCKTKPPFGLVSTVVNVADLEYEPILMPAKV
jgi:hypothetical protein